MDNMLDLRLWDALVGVAIAKHSGHLTVMRFTTNWRISFGTPTSNEAIDKMFDGKTFAEAAIEALRNAAGGDVPF